jgi:hypothetical protein
MASATAVGYSGKSLAQKLGLKEGQVIAVLNAPEDYSRLLGQLPPAIEFVVKPSGRTDLVHMFTSDATTLEKELQRLRRSLKPDAAVWVSWPKKASKFKTDVTEDTIRKIALPMGFVDVKVCAVSEIWSGLKLVVRKSLRTHDA